MWNHAQNCSSSGDEDAIETDLNLWQKERIEKSLDLTQYLKYLDHLFGQATSESEYSDSDDGDRNRTFTEFRQPPVATQPQERSHYTQNHLLPGPSTSSESSNHVNSFQFKTTENFQIESNISSSSLSSIDSGTSSLSLNLSSDTCTETLQNKTDDLVLVENTGNGLNSSVGGAEEENAASNSGDKDKKSQKKKKSAKNSSEDLPRQHKPSSGGKGNNGYKGGGGAGGGAAPPGGDSNDSSGGSSGSGGSSSSNQSTSSNNGSPGAKSRCGENSLQQADSQPEVITATNESSREGISASNSDCNDTSSIDLQNVLGMSSSDSLLLNGDLTDSFEPVDTFDSSEISCFRLDSLLDSIPEEETSLSDFISLSSSAHSTNSPSTVTQSTNFFSKIAEAAATSVKTYSGYNKHNGLLRNSNMNDSSKVDGKKRKIENNQFDKFATLTDKQKQSKIEYFNAKRRKIYINISRKDVIKTQKSRALSFKEGLIIRRKLAHACAQEVRKNQIQLQPFQEEELEERDIPKAIENESFTNPTIIGSPIQDNRLDRLLTLMELFANKLLDQNIIEVDLLHFNDVTVVNGPIILENPDSERTKSSILSTVARAAKEHHNLVKLLDMSGLYVPAKTVNGKAENYAPIIQGSFLKKHQAAGIRWINQLYRKGLNGILADESGLGKKAQIIGFFSHLAESYSLFGPFLIVAPSSSVNIWQHEINRLCPKFKVVSYWGKPQDRKILRQVWEKNCIHTEKSSFHIIVTSYPVMVADLKYFSKTKWQYLIVDDSHNAITASTKWMAILSFRCRSKLLLCSNPRLNSIPHLCSYLYFIMPSLFDSQKELSEFLLNELESPTTKTKCEIHDDKSATASRLKVITQAFTLRREMQDVEMEIITPGIDVLLKCPLTIRQRQIYAGLLEETDLRDALTNLENCQPQEIRTRVRKALNLSLQLRMTCNHPNLIEERVHSTAFWMDTPLMKLPQLIYERSIMNSSDEQSLKHLFCIFSAFNVYNSLYKYSSKSRNNGFSTWSFSRILNLNWKEVEELFLGGYESRLNLLVDSHSVLQKIQHDAVWVENRDSKYLINYPTALRHHFLSQNKVLSALVFTPNVCTWRKCRKVSLMNSIQYQRLKSRYIFQGNKNAQTISLCNRGLTHPILPVCPSLEYPDFFKCYSSNVYSKGYIPLISCSTINRHVMMKENRFLISDVINKIDLDSFGGQNKVSIIKENLLYNGSHRFLPVHDRLIGDSGKVMILDDMLTNFNQTKRRVLLVTYVKSSLRVIEEFLKIRNWKFVLIEDSHNYDVENDVCVYLMFAHSSVSDFKISIDTVIFFDHDWGIKMEEQKNRLLQKIGHSDNVDFYRLVCSETIEERMVAGFIASAKETKIDSQTLSTHESTHPALKSLVSILIDEWQQERGWPSKPSLTKHKSNFSQPFPLETQSKDIKLRTHVCAATSSTKDSCRQDGADIDYVSENEGPDSTSPNCSEDQELYMDEDDLNVTRCQTEDNFSLSFDEGYMGMSPDSFEDTTIKSDYEENSSPKKPKMGRGAGKRGRPPSRIRLHNRIMCNESGTFRRGPGRPRSKTMPANQGGRGRRPGRPPLTHKAETVSSGQNVFAFYSSTDLELS